jgi:type II secretory pathway component PulC
MPTIQFYRPGQHLLTTALNYTMLVILAATLAYWFWVFFKPAAIPLAPAQDAPAQTLLPAIQASNWFGVAAHADTNAAPAQAFRLVGIISAKRGRSSAIFQFADGKQRLIGTAQEISPGVRLIAVKKEEVIIHQNGAESTLKLERQAATH